jgi:PAS domain S-box-containing protein
MANTKIMVVEDDGLVAAHLERALQQMGYEVAAVLAAGEEAVDQAGELRPDLILMDIKLRDKMTGVEAAALLHNRWDIPVVYLTAYADEAILQQAKVTEPYGYLAKPVRDKELHATIEMALYKHHTDRRLTHLTKVLRAIRDVNQLITRDHDQAHLLAEACQILVRGRGYALAWIALPGPNDDLIPVGRAGQGQDFVEIIIEAMVKNPTGQIPCMAVVRSQQQVVCQNAATAVCKAFCRETALVCGLASAVATPMLHAGRLLGVLCVHATKPNAFDEEELALLNELAGDLALALNNIEQVTQRQQVEEALRRRNRELNLLNQVITTAIANPESILETTCRIVADTFETSQVTAALLDDKRDRATVVAGYTAKGSSQRQTAETPATLEHVIQVKRNPAIRYLLRQQKPLVINNDEPRLASLRGGLCQEGAVSALVAPLIHKGQVLGLLCLDDTHPRQFSSEEINVIESIAGQVAAALVRAKASLVQQRLSMAIAQAAECVVITDARGYIVYVNPAFEHITGYSAGEALGQNPRILKSDRHDPAFYQNLWSTITAGEVWHGRLINKKKDGALYTEEATISPLKDEQGKIINYVAVKRDITNELQLEEQYRQAQKMQAVGQLTAGVAHNFNNLLTAINGFAELSQARLPADHPLQSMLEAILRSGQNATDLVKQLMIFSRKQMVEPQIVDINAVVAKMEKLLRSIIGEHIALKTTLAAEVWPVKVDPAQFEQVIVNLAVNARDAMPNGGCLTLETANIILDKEYVADHLGVTPGEYVLLAVSDNGLGMTETVKAHIFEPFFTTKETGKGTGLGLATVFGVVKQSGGHIWVYSELDQGTTFKIYLPRVRVAAKTVIQDDTAVLPAGHETILLVEDNPGVQQVSVAMLREQGYTVLAADNGEQAQRLAQDYSESIDLLITDVVMPGDNGRVVAEKLRQHWPNLKCLFISGYTDEVVERHGVLSPGEAFLSKPFTVPMLARKVREVLDRPDRQT